LSGSSQSTAADIPSNATTSEGDNIDLDAGHVKRLHTIPNFADTREYRLGDRRPRRRGGRTGIAENQSHFQNEEAWDFAAKQQTYDKSQC